MHQVFSFNLVNIIQVSMFTLCLFGLLLLLRFRPYRQICLLLGLVVLASLFNLWEEAGDLKQIHLVTPIFVLGFGPAIYLAVKGLLGEKIVAFHYVHFAPMLLALPFTATPSIVLAVGTLWRLAYSALTLKKLLQFKSSIVNFRSDTEDLSIAWLSWSIIIMTIVSIANLIRINFQVQLGVELNTLGQGISSFVALCFFGVLIYQLIHHKEDFFSLHRDSESSWLSEASRIPKDLKESEDSIENFKVIHDHLVKEISANQWFKIPRLTLNQLSELSGFHIRDVSRAINLVAHCNFNDFINEYRVNYVTEQLRKGYKTSLLDVAIDAGFNAKSTFNVAFKRHHGESPIQYKKRVAIESG